MQQNTLLLSIHPNYSEKIFVGLKTVELRRVRPRVAKGDVVLVYATSPQMELIGAFEVSSVIEAVPKELWSEVADYACIDKDSFDSYFLGAKCGYGIEISYSWQFETPLSLSSLRQRIPGFCPPQGYRYLSTSEVNQLELDSPLVPI